MYVRGVDWEWGRFEIWEGEKIVLFKALSASRSRKSRVVWMSERDSLTRPSAALSGGRVKLEIMALMSWIDYISCSWRRMYKSAHRCWIFVEEHFDDLAEPLFVESICRKY